MQRRFRPRSACIDGSHCMTRCAGIEQGNTEDREMAIALSVTPCKPAKCEVFISHFFRLLLIHHEQWRRADENDSIHVASHVPRSLMRELMAVGYLKKTANTVQSVFVHFARHACTYRLLKAFIYAEEWNTANSDPRIEYMIWYVTMQGCSMQNKPILKHIFRSHMQFDWPRVMQWPENCGFSAL
jgi:hypothetical protein